MALAVVLVLWWINPTFSVQPVVRAVLFYSPACPHCHKVIREDLPPLIRKYGTQLQVAMLDITGNGRDIYRTAIQRFNIPRERQGVPTLIVGTVVLVGSHEIPAQFPALIESGLKSGGVDWPDLAGLAGPSPPEAKSVEPQPSGLFEKLGRDPLGNGLAVLVLTGMIATAGWIVYRLPRKVSPQKQRSSGRAWKKWGIPVLALIGLAISVYLSYVEIMMIQPFCGPVGDCGAVQQSEYARLFGVIPVGLAGVAGNLLIMAAWGIREYGNLNLAKWGAKGLAGLTTIGVLFSIYLTFLEPFVIGATCMWCLTSAIVMTGMFWLSVKYMWEK